MGLEEAKSFWRMVYAFRQKYNLHELTIPELVQRIRVLKCRLAAEPWGICKEQRRLWKVALTALNVEWKYRRHEFCETASTNRFGD